jgi:mannosyl-oligosaccharide glucosidase
MTSVGLLVQVWINMNFMVLSALKSYAERPGPYQKEARDLHDSLRNNLVKVGGVM